MPCSGACDRVRSHQLVDIRVSHSRGAFRICERVCMTSFSLRHSKQLVIACECHTSLDTMWIGHNLHLDEFEYLSGDEMIPNIEGK